MKRAWMLWSGAFLAVTIVGCNETGTWSDGWPRPQQKVTSDPVKNNPAADETALAPIDTSKEPPAGGVDALASKVESFVGQFPPDDRDRATKSANASSTASPATQPAAPAPVQKPEAVAAVPAAPPATPAPVTANAPAISAAAASPKPIQVLPEKPTATPPIEITEVRAAPNTAAASQPSAAAANQPIQAVAAPAGNGGITPMIEELLQSIALHPQQWEDQFKLRLLYAATAQDEKATGPIDRADPVQTELMSGAFRLLIGVRDAMRNPAGGGPTALTAADELRRLLSQQSPIMIPKVALVTRVNSFGDYDAVNPPRFPAGQAVHVFLYAEVANFRSESTGDGRLRTWLAEKVEIFDQAGKVIWQRSEPSIEDRVYSPRRDFFMTMEVQLPADIPAGEYVLKITVEDKLGATTDQQRMSFAIQ